MQQFHYICCNDADPPICCGNFASDFVIDESHLAPVLFSFFFSTFASSLLSRMEPVSLNSFALAVNCFAVWKFLSELLMGGCFHLYSCLPYRLFKAFY
jgi:hypothetical protein